MDHKYEILEKIYEGVNTIIYKAKNTENSKNVIIKVLKSIHASKEETEQLRQEYEIAKYLMGFTEGTVEVYEFTKFNNIPALVMEDFGGVSLNKIFENSKPDLQQILKMAVKLAKTIGDVHKAGIIHKDIKPQNVIVKIETNDVKLTDFGISTKYAKEQDEKSELKSDLEGTLSYISPEQTGRMNRAIDYRSDLYSLGISLYEMITGKLPFETQDPLELVHQHIAVRPDSPKELNNNIPKVLSEIIMKLLEKNPENRYQSDFGLLYDLEKCLTQLKENNTIEDFEIAQNEIFDKIQIPEKLYGRNKELEQLKSIYNNVLANNYETVFIKGKSGIGKTSLVFEFNRENPNKKGYFISGTFDQFKQNIPYNGIIQAFNGLMKNLLTESQSKINEWKEKLLEALKDKGQVITEIIPSLETIIGKQPPVPELKGDESFNRFNMVFQDFVKVFSFENHPLTIFLDNLQWIDTASSILLQKLLTNASTNNLMFIGAYQEEVIKTEHPVIEVQKEIKNSEIPLTEIELKPIGVNSISRLIVDTLSIDKNDIDKMKEVTKLSEVIKTKTNSNPFFVRNFISTVFDNKLLKYNANKAEWEWNLEEMQKAGFSDNVVELTINKIQSLPTNTQNVLRLASCIGEEFNYEILSLISGSASTEEKKQGINIKEGLKEAVNEGLIIPAESSEKNKAYKFIHIRIQEASYSMLSDKLKSKIHLKLGRMMVKRLTKKDIENEIFDIVNHLNHSLNLIKSDSEKLNISKLYHIAAKKAKESTAYEQALEYITIAKNILNEDSWDTYNEYTYLIYKTCSEYNVLNKNYTESENLLNMMLDKAKNRMQKAEIYDGILRSHLFRGKIEDALKAGLEATEMFDIHLSDNEEEMKPLVEKEQKALDAKLGNRKPQELLDAPLLKKQDYIKLIDILLNVNVCANRLYKHNIARIALLKQIQILVEYGQTNKSAYSYVMYSYYLRTIGQDEEAYKWGLMSMRMCDKFNNPAITSAVYNMFASSINPVRNSIKSSFPLFNKANKFAIETGQWSLAAAILANSSFMMLSFGEELIKVLKYVSDGIEFTRRIKNPNIEKILTIIQRSALNLLGKTENKASLSSPDKEKPDEEKDEIDQCCNKEKFNEKDFIKKVKESKSGIAVEWYYYFKLMVLAVNKEFEKAIELVKEVKQHNELDGTENFYYLLALFHQYKISESPQESEKNLIAKLIEIVKKESENESELICKYNLVKAEYEAYIQGNHEKAMTLYDTAIKESQKIDNVIDLAICNEYTARYYYERGFDFIGKAYIIEAHYQYNNWGAVTAITKIEQDYQFLVTYSDNSQEESTSLSLDKTITGQTSSDKLDLATILKASQAIAGEIVLDKLLKILMKIVIENAGAEKGYLIMEKAGSLFIEAEGSVNKNEIIVLQSLPIEENLPVSIINYVERTKEDVVLNDASKEDTFSSDKYITGNMIRSVLSTPLINQGKLVGILYLENNLTTGAFSKGKIEVLKLLSSQISVSIENAKFYEELEQKVQERTKELAKAHKELEQTFEEVNTLKIQQDGDYFLTSLLIKPLMTNQVKSNTVNIDYIAIQKKKFKFRKWKEELGGDICIAHTIPLKNKKHTVFVNGDAMGKSIQGAGGALVLGVVFNALVERTKYKEKEQEVTPDEWLIECYKELQSIFESFDGSMLISVVMGIVEDDTGLMYYFNAEHPFTTLYRKGKASFIENEIGIRKIGSMGFDQSLEIKTFQLKHNDSIIAGSDGRDDILLGHDEETGFRIINEDEEKFLENIEKGEGDLEKILEAIKEIGELTDDISLLKITYKKD